MAMKIYSNTAFVGNGTVVLGKLYFSDGTPTEIIITSDDECTGVTVMIDKTANLTEQEIDEICNSHQDCESRPLYDDCENEYESEDDMYE